jgi:sugar/nucleoside kinase (ribokinase family)
MSIEKVTGVLCCGNISFDIPVWPVDRFVWGTTLWVDAIEESVGGNGGNTSYALGMLGVPVRLIGTVGRDVHGDTVLSLLQSAGVDTAMVRRSDKPTNSSICVVHPSGDRLFLHQRGASTDVIAEQADFQPQTMVGFSHFHLANLYTLPVMRTYAPAALQRARSAGLTTSLDTGWDAEGEWMKLLAPCLPHLDLLFVNETEGKMLTGFDEPRDAAAALRAQGASDIVMKLGGQGCIVFQGANEYAVPGFPVKAIDTTGAGDTFAGGFLSALHRGWPFAEAARLANAVGALKVEKLGAVKGVRNFEETLAWMSARNTLER